MCIAIPPFLAGVLGVAYLVLRPTILDTDHNPSWSVSNSHCTVCGVNMLTSSSVCTAQPQSFTDAQAHQDHHIPLPSSSEGVHLNILIVDNHLNVLRLW